MKKWIMILMVTLLFVGCGPDDRTIGVEDGATVEPGAELPVNDDATSEMVDEAYYLTGELLEVNDLSVLIDSEEVGLVWVSFEALPSVELNPKSIVRALYDGAVMESYPNQAIGTSLEILEPFDEAFIYTYDEMVDMIADGDVNHVVEWNTNKDTVAYAQIDLEAGDGSYFIRIANLYEKGSVLVGYVAGEMPDLAWFYNTLQIQSSDQFVEVRPPFEAIILDDGATSEPSEQVNELEYELTLNEFVNGETVITYFTMSGHRGELVQDYINQSLYKVVDTFGDYAQVKIESFVVQEGATLTVGYKGYNKEWDRNFEHYLTIDVATATEWTFEETVADKEAFYAMFEEVYDPHIREQEGIRLYVKDDFLVINYVPMDDMAERVFYEIKMEEITPFLNLDFEMPAS